MALAIYKKGQGFWTRVLSLVGAMTLLLAGVAWLWTELSFVPWHLDQRQEVTIAADALPQTMSLRSLGVMGFVEAAEDQTQSMKIRSLASGSPAQRADIRSGDAIVAVAGRPVTSREELAQALETAPAGQPLALTVERQRDLMGIVRLAVTVALILLGGGLILWIMNRPRVVDFMIATESEMRKVNWPSRREIIGSTWVVVCGTFMLAFALWVVNVGFSFLFQKVGILHIGG